MSMRLQRVQLRNIALTRHLPVFRAADFRALEGVNEGDPLTDAADLAHEDVYALSDRATPVRLGLVTGGRPGPFLVSRDSGAGRPGAFVYLDSLLTFMAPAGGSREALVFVEVDAEGTIAEVYLHPLAPFPPKQPFALVTIDCDGARARLDRTAGAAFARGTRITLAGGAQRPIEELRPGDRILTRESGPQVLRWIGRDRVDATGPFAPITVRAGALQTTGDLVVNPGHRPFVHQREGAVAAGRDEIPVPEAQLVNGTTVTRGESDRGNGSGDGDREADGSVDYFQLLFDKHEIVFAEGIAAESLFVDPCAAPSLLPDAVGGRVTGTSALPRLPASARDAAEISRHKDALGTLERLSAL